MSYFINTDPITVGEGGTGLETTGTVGQILTTVSPGVTGWLDPATNGTVTSVALTTPSHLTITGSPITSSGTLAITLSGTALPTTSGGTGLTSVGTSGQILRSNGSAFVMGNDFVGTVTSVGATVPAFLSAGPAITSSGNIAISLSGSALPIVNGGTGLTAGGVTNQVLTTTAPNTYGWTTPTTGTVTSIGITPPAHLTASGPITSSGNITLSFSGSALPTTSGGTGLTTVGGTGTFLQSNGGTPAWQVLDNTTTTGGAYFGGGANKPFPLVSGTQVGTFSAGIERILMLAPTSSVLEIGSTTDFNNRLFISAATANAFWQIGNTTSLATKKIQFDNEITLPATKPLSTLYGGTGLTTVGATGTFLQSNAGTPVWQALDNTTTTSGAYFGGGALKAFPIVSGTQVGTFSAGTERILMLAATSSVLEIGSTTDFTNRLLISAATANAFWQIGNTSALATKKIQFDNEITLPTTKPLLPIYGGTGLNSPGVDTQILTMVAGAPAWAAPATNGTVTSVGIIAPAHLTASAPITSSGNITIGLSGVALPVINGGTGLNTQGTNGQLLATVSGALAYTNTISTLITTGISRSLKLGLSGTFQANFGGFDPSGATQNFWTINWQLIGNMCHCYMYGNGYNNATIPGLATAAFVTVATANPAYQNAICLPFSMQTNPSGFGNRFYIGTNITWTGATTPLEGQVGSDNRFMDFYQPNGTEPGLPTVGNVRNCGGVQFIYRIDDSINPTTVTQATNTGVFI